MADLVIVNPSSGDKTTSLFTDPDSSSGVVASVEKGTILKVTGTSGNYYMVEYDNGKPNVTQGGTANTGIVIAYPYATMYLDTRKKAIAGNINNGTAIDILDDSNHTLIKVKAATTQGVLEGYIDAKHIYRDNEDTPVMFRMTRNASSGDSTPTSGIVTPKVGLKCRTGPGASYKYVGAFNYNAKLTIHESKNGYYRVTGTSGWGDLTDIWVSAQYVSFFYWSIIALQCCIGVSCIMKRISYCCCLFSRSVVSDSATPRTVAHQASLSFTIFLSLVRLLSIESVVLSNHLILCCPFSCPQSFPASGSFPMSQLFASGGQSIGA